jgi:tetratricopeptide (TPR) repeat protein
MIFRRTLPAPRTSAALAALVLFAVTFLTLRALRETPPAQPPPVAFARDTDGRIAAAQSRIERDPDDASALTDLALASLDKVREVGDPSWYARAEQAAARALEIDRGNAEAMDALGQLALARHRWPEALDWARRSRLTAPARFAPLGIAGDALLELGRYDRAFATIDRRLQLRPDLASYSRASYAAELRGERAEAIALMGLAVDAGRPGSESRAWTRVQLGLLHFGAGGLLAAKGQMQAALDERPGDARALAGLAKVLAAQGHLEAAARRYSAAIDRLPLPEYPAALAEIELERGRPAAARENLELVRAMQALLADSGVRTDLDLALIEADFARPTAEQVAAARAARDARPGIVGDDVLGWVLTRSGACEEGLAVARRSLRLGTRDALMLFHAGMAAACAGQRGEAAGRLRAALALNPRFSVRWAPVAKATLARMAAT